MLQSDAISPLKTLLSIVFTKKYFQSHLKIFNNLLQAYYREGVALQCLGKHAEALAAFSQGLCLTSNIQDTRVKVSKMSFPGLAQDPKSLQLLAGLVEAAMKSPLKGKKLSGKFASCHPLFKSVSGRVC